MKIEVWSDFTCPFCFIGKKRLELAIKQFDPANNITIEYKSFELKASPDKNCAVSKVDLLMNKYNLTRKQTLEMLDDVWEQGQEIGLDITLNDIIHINTFKAHRLVKYSSSINKASTLIDLIFDSYFIKKENIENKQVLLRLAEEAGLDKYEADALLCLNNYAKQVKYDQQLAEELGITAVLLHFNEKYAISGAQSIEMFLTILTEVYHEELTELPLPNENTCKKSYCTGNECEAE